MPCGWRLAAACRAPATPAPAQPTASARTSGRAIPASASQVGSAAPCHPFALHTCLCAPSSPWLPPGLSLLSCPSPEQDTSLSNTHQLFWRAESLLSPSIHSLVPWPLSGGRCLFTRCSLSPPQGTTGGTVWMCVTSTPARTSPCVAASQARPWAMCASVARTSLGSTVSTGEMWGTGQGHGSVTRDLSVPPCSLEQLG